MSISESKLSSFRLHLAVKTLAAGGIVAYPTEGVWGLGCDPANPMAVARLLQLKQRPVNKGLILLAGAVEQFAQFTDSLTDGQRLRLTLSWPGPMTWLVPQQQQVPPWISGGRSKVACRVSAHYCASALSLAFGGPIVSTSANPTGRQSAKHGFQVRRYFGDDIDYILSGSTGGLRGATMIKDLETDAIIRHNTSLN